MKSKLFTILAFSAVALVAAAAVPVFGDGAMGKTTVMTTSDLKWKDMGIPGVVAAPVSGDMDKGPSRFFLKYPVGFVTPKHHHTTDHYVTVVSGSLTLTVGGKDYRLGPGSYFALTGKASHVARVEGKEEAVFFIQADGPWDVMVEK